MVAEHEIPLQIQIKGKTVPSQTLAAEVGAYVLALSTVLPDQAIDLHSTYTGHPEANTLASHLLLARDAYQAIAATHDHDDLPLTHQRRRLLYDHLQRLQELLAQLDIDARLQVDDHAIETIEQ
ncbi:MAG TPA: hypothetical protein VFW38_03225 [Solirubrobacteraceae bacterium]|nr:hypothetical protein [Solirubrobacteraceae bacterium]